MTIDEIHSGLSSIQQVVQSNSSDELRLCKLGEHDHKMAIVLSLVIKGDFTWSPNVHGVDIDGKRPPISKFSNPLWPADVNQFIEHLDKLTVCPGHPDSHFIEFAMAKKKIHFC